MATPRTPKTRHPAKQQSKEPAQGEVGQGVGVARVGRKRTEWTDRQKGEALAVLDQCGGNCKRAEAITGVPDSTLSQWQAGRHVNADVPEIRDGTKEWLAGESMSIACLAAQRIKEEIPLMDHRALITAYGVTTDKFLVINQLPTVITATTEAQTPDQAKDLVLKHIFNARPSPGVTLVQGGDSREN